MVDSYMVASYWGCVNYVLPRQMCLLCDSVSIASISCLQDTLRYYTTVLMSRNVEESRVFGQFVVVLQGFLKVRRVYFLTQSSTHQVSLTDIYIGQ